MESYIGSAALKIACIQTIPGAEQEVRSSLEQACSNLGITEYAALKGLGKFDIIFIYSPPDFGNHVRQAGPIPQILKSNLFLCFPYLGTKAEEIIHRVKSNEFTAFSLLKINPGTKRLYTDVDRLFRTFIHEHHENISILGSLGWNEIILLMSARLLDDVIKRLNYASNVVLSSKEGNNLSILIKTLTFFGISYTSIPPSSVIDKGIASTKRHFTRRKAFKSFIFAHPKQKQGLSISIEVVAKPPRVQEICQYFTNTGFRPTFIIGKEDILFSPTRKMQLGHYLASLLVFRRKYRDYFFSTTTRLLLADSSIEAAEEEPFRMLPINMEYAELENIFGPETASILATHFYTINSLLQNPLCGSVYEDIVEYPDYIIESGRTIKGKGQDVLNFAQGAYRVLTLGAELRSYGTYETIEEVTGRFSEFKGGCQLALLALEFFPSYILESFDQKWMGFITTGDVKFLHVNEVINVPNEALWDPREWWALYHEIGHIILANFPEWVNLEIPSIRQFLSTRDYPSSHWDTIIECTAEVIGFELGFFGNFDLFLTTLWRHLSKIDPYQRQNVEISSYAVRTFFTKLFEGHFRKNTNIPYISKAKILDLDYLYQSFIEHMDSIEDKIGKTIFEDKSFLSAKFAKLFRDLYPFAKHLKDCLSLYEISVSRSALTIKNSRDVVASIKRGQVWWDKVIYPEAVIYSIIQESNLTFSSKIATVITFWNQYITRKRAGGNAL